MTIVKVNDFGAIGDGQSHPLSESYATLALAQVAYPTATSLNDEKDWCAWQAATDFVYDRDDDPLSPVATENWSCGTIEADGRYVLNRTVTFNHLAVEVRGVTQGTRFPFNSATTIVYNGPDGTLDDPVYIFDFYMIDEFGNPAPGRKGNAASSGIKARVRNIVFYGKGGDMRGGLDASGFVSAIRFRRASFASVTDCNFSGTLFDGIVATDSQLFLTVSGNFFYSVHRDAIGVRACQGDFSTTTSFYNNEFGFVGRYAIILDLYGSVEAFPILRDNSFEHSYPESYFVQNPEWFVHGVVSAVCFINCGNMLFDGNRMEGVTGITAGYWCDVHMVRCTAVTLQNSIFHNLAMTANKQSAKRTTAADQFLVAKRYLDITNERNYNCGEAADYADQNEEVAIRKIYNLGKILIAGERGISSSNTIKFEDTGALTMLSLPLRDGEFARVVQPRQDAIPSLQSVFGNCRIDNSTITDPNGIRAFGSFNMETMTGDYRIVSPTFASWAPSTSYLATLPTEELTIFRLPTMANGHFYQCVGSGMSGTTEPVWPLGVGQEVVDGTVTWRCVGNCAVPSEHSANEWQCGGHRNRRSYDGSIPTFGQWDYGDKVWFRIPSAGGYIGAVCVAPGSPGTWKQFGAVGV